MEHPNTKLSDTRSDVVNHHAHYQNGGIETIDVIKAWCGEDYYGFLEGNILKYLSRWRNKNGLEDLKKAQWYLTMRIAEIENS